MTVKKFRISRRAVLRGTGTIAIGLPWLECMQDDVKAQAAPAAAQRFVGVYQPGGTVLDKWRPTGTETAPVFGTILAPLEPVKDKLLVIDGLEMKCAVGEQHQSGMIAFLTGAVQGTPQKYSSSKPGAENASIDQLIAAKISKETKPMASLQIAVRWATGKSHGLLSPINALSFENTTTNAPMPPRLEPSEIWTALFGSLSPMTPAMDTALLRKKSILDFVDKRYAALAARVSASDRIKIEDHLDKIRQIEQGLTETAVPPTSSACEPPKLIDTSGYNAKSGLNSAEDGSTKDAQTDGLIPKVGTLMMDMLVMGLACERTAVATLQWSDSEAKHTFPWLNLSEHHHYYQHDGGFNAPACEKIAIWYSQMHLYLLQAMAAVDMGGHSLLDESVVFFGSEISDPPTHLKQNMPFLLAGNGGGLRTGRHVKCSGPHNDLLVSILNLFGDARTKFGNSQYCDGPLTNLL